jgi:putative copper resistance protein D
VLAAAVVAARLAQFTGAIALFGSSLFFVYGLPANGPGAASGWRWPRPALLGAALALLLAAGVALCAQTAIMSGAAVDALRPDAVASVITDSQFGLGTAGRFGLGVLSGLVLVLARPSRALWLATSALGAIAIASFAWTGHGAAGDGVWSGIHLASDVLHLLAAGVWLGALAVLSILVLLPAAPHRQEGFRPLHGALKGFSGIGSATVAVLLATGLVNSWVLVGPAHAVEMVRSPYGLLLLAKIALFAAMLGLAAANRLWLTPRLGAAIDGRASTRDATANLRLSVLLETSIGAVVLVLVSVLGTLAPPSSQ